MTGQMSNWQIECLSESSLFCKFSHASRSMLRLLSVLMWWFCCCLLVVLWDSVIVLCFVVRYFVSILVLQSSF